MSPRPYRGAGPCRTAASPRGRDKPTSPHLPAGSEPPVQRS
ncbi:hypothetical protein STRTUCAR8_07941 [Streptomyces turgidiscabies Car8]|uniref:Uncharacterized protein n=1 Tax=Streptomyces turgidiscabies (strain Car8) TaxID=698760 RepID=L7FIY9_STRT8|nr:hypothetical protein STRTUCAR8_07941 [Streptomyces turgidiscabies Car8]